MFGLSLPVLLIIAAAAIFDFLNGFRDSAGIVATLVASRVLTPRQALRIAAMAEFVGPFIFGTAVARTWGRNVLADTHLALSVLLAALVTAAVWNLVTWLVQTPSSSSHALIGALLGAAVAQDGLGVVKAAGLIKILVALALSPPASLLVGVLTMRLILYLVRGATPRVNLFFRRSQVGTAIGLALAYGANDTQKTMGVVTLALATAGLLPSFQVPWWVVGLSAGAVALGIMVGSRRMIRTLGLRFYKVRPVHGFATQVASAAVILAAALMGAPVSSTQVVTTAIMGVGAAERMSKVRWGMASGIVVVWLTTIPLTALLGAVFSLLFRAL